MCPFCIKKFNKYERKRESEKGEFKFISFLHIVIEFCQ